MKTIPLTRGFVALVDDEDFERVNQHKWHAESVHNTGNLVRAARTVWVEGRQKKIYMHRAILGITETGQHVDHINRNPLDNRRMNLRSATITENNRNQGVRGEVPYKGVWREKNKFKAQIKVDGQKVRLGSFVKAEDAAKAYDQKAALFFGEFAYLNFPESVTG